MNKKILFSPAGWEPRYEAGVYIDLEEFAPSEIIVPFSSGYHSRTTDIRGRIRDKATSAGILYREMALDYTDPVSLYKELLAIFANNVPADSVLRFNCSTTPRDFIWYVLHFLSERKITTQFSYFRPLEYGEYLSRDARAPRFVLKRSGIAYPELPMCILVLAGFDEERLSQLKQRYEPKTMLIGHQTGSQLGNKVRNSLLECENVEGEIHFDFDCYDLTEDSLKILIQQVDKLSESHNVVAASLGPKPGALTLFKLTQIRPQIGLVYISANDYSENYSSGINLESRTLNEMVW